MDLLDIRKALAAGKSVTDLKLRVTYYARVSTDKDAQLHSLQAQVDNYREVIQNNPNWTFVEGYIDEGISATSMDKRDSFLRMMEDAKLHKFDLILTKGISRFSRNTVDSILCTQELLRHGIGVLFESDSINTLLADSELRLTIMASIAQEEVRKLSERVKWGYQQAIKKGVVLGSDFWGYRKDKGKLVIVEEEAELVRKIFEMYATEGKGLRAISTWLADHGYLNKNGNAFTYSTLRNIIRNMKYKGYYCAHKTEKVDFKFNQVKQLPKEDWVIYKDESGEIVPAIVSEELWDRANEILEQRSKAMSSNDKTSYQNKYAFSGKIICMEHNVPYHRTAYRYKGREKEVWQCREFAARGKSGCSMPVIYTAELNEILRQIFDMLVQDKDKIIEKMLEVYKSISTKSSLQSDIAKLNVEIKNLEKRKVSLIDLYSDGALSRNDFAKQNNDCNTQIEECEKKIEDLQEEQAKNEKLTESVETLRAVITRELNFEDGMDNSLVDKFIDRIEVYKTDKEKEVRLKVYVKPLDNKMLPFHIKRNRGKEASVCCEQYT